VIPRREEQAGINGLHRFRLAGGTTGGIAKTIPHGPVNRDAQVLLDKQ
jgi:hypothetical protein